MEKTQEKIKFSDLTNFSPKQKEAEEALKQYKYVLYGGALGGGKQTSLNTIIPTCQGYTTMGEVKVGDYILSSDGNPVEVIRKTDVDYNPDAYEVEFDSGEKIKCDGNHLWLTMNIQERQAYLRLTDSWREKRRNSRKSRAIDNPKKLSSQKNITLSNKNREYVYKEQPTGTIRATKDMLKDFRGTWGFNYSVDVTEPINLPEKNLLVEPYLFGLWLGDGYSRTGMVGMMVSDIEQIKCFLPKDIKETFRIEQGRKDFSMIRFDKLTSKLRKLNCYRNKHIPIDYLRSSIEQRKALLQGLMDTDGYCSKDGKCGIQLSNKKLMEDVLELVTSLGIKATISERNINLKGKDYGSAYRICFMAEFPVFRLPRKIERQKMTDLRSTNKRRYIVSIKKIEPEPMQCLTVANDDGMYLIGRTFVPTHNSYWLRWMLLKLLIQYYQTTKRKGIMVGLFCEDYPALKDRQLSKIKFEFPEWLGSYSSQDHNFTLKDEYGAGVIAFRNLDDVSKYKSAEFAAIGVDELTQNTEDIFIFLRTRLRWSGIDNTRFLAATNPDGIGYLWVKTKWIDGIFDPNENEKEMFHFVKALPTDNPHLDATYISSLSALPDKKRNALLYGDWDSMEGQFFEEWNVRKHVVIPFDIPNSWRKFRSIDVGGRNGWTACGWYAMDYDGNIWKYREYYATGKDSEEHAKNIVELTRDEQIQYTVIDNSAFSQIGLPETIAEIYMKNGVENLVPSSKDRLAGWDFVHQFLRHSATEEPKLKFFDTCKHAIRTLPAVIYDMNNSGDVDTDCEDHIADEVRYFIQTVREGRSVRPETSAQKRLKILYNN